jgi:hypothetical protein
LRFSKAEFNGIGELLIYIQIVPTCGTFLPVDFGPGLPPCWLGPFLSKYGKVSSGSASTSRQAVSAGRLDDQAHSGG